MLQMCGVIAEFERSIIRERINSGFTRAKANGEKLGRPRVDESIDQAIREALYKGEKEIWKIAREMAVGASVVQRSKMKPKPTI